MRNTEVHVGSVYAARVNGQLVRVRVEERFSKPRTVRGKPVKRTFFRVRNEQTGRELERSAAGLRPIKLRLVPPPAASDAEPECSAHGTLCADANCAVRERDRVFREAMARS